MLEEQQDEYLNLVHNMETIMEETGERRFLTIDKSIVIVLWLKSIPLILLLPVKMRKILSELMFTLSFRQDHMNIEGYIIRQQIFLLGGRQRRISGRK